MSKKLVSLLLAAALLLGLVPVMAEAPVITVTDMAGREISLTEPAEKIVAIYPSDCEIIAAIGCEDALVGVGAFCNYPASVTSLPKIQSGAEMNVEEIIALEPQVVLLNSMVNVESQVSQLEENGIHVVISTTSDIESVYTAIAMIGKLMGKDAEAAALVADMQGTFDEIKNKATDEGKKVYFEISPPPWLFTAGATSYMNELAEICGVTNIFADLEDAWPMISDEQVIERNPDYIVLMSGMGSQGVDEILAREGWGDINAIQNKKVFNDDESRMTVPGPRLKEAAVDLYNFVNDIAAEEPAA